MVGAACQDLQRSRDTPVSVSVLFNDRSVVAPVQKEERVFSIVRVLVRHSFGEGVVKPSAEVKRRLGGWEWLGGVELVEDFGVVVGVFDWEEGGGVEVLEVDVEVVGVVEVEEDIGEVYEVGGAPDLEVDEAAVSYTHLTLPTIRLV